MNPTDQILESLRVENERLRREVECQKLKAAGYERLIEIIRQEDGINLQKNMALQGPKRACPNRMSNKQQNACLQEFTCETMETR